MPSFSRGQVDKGDDFRGVTLNVVKYLTNLQQDIHNPKFNNISMVKEKERSLNNPFLACLCI